MINYKIISKINFTMTFKGKNLCIHVGIDTYKHVHVYIYTTHMYMQNIHMHAYMNIYTSMHNTHIHVWILIPVSDTQVCVCGGRDGSHIIELRKLMIISW